MFNVSTRSSVFKTLCTGRMSPQSEEGESVKNNSQECPSATGFLIGCLSPLRTSPLPTQPSCILTSFGPVCVRSHRKPCDCLSLSQLCSLDRALLSARVPQSYWKRLECHIRIQRHQSKRSGLKEKQFLLTAGDGRRWGVAAQDLVLRETGVATCRILKTCYF